MKPYTRPKSLEETKQFLDYRGKRGMKDLKPLFTWAKERGDANIHDRILIKMMPFLLKEQLTLTSESIEDSQTIEVSEELYDAFVEKTQNLVGAKYV